MKKFFLVAFIALTAAPSLGADAGSPAENLAMFAGSWQSQATLQQPSGKPMQVSGTISCAWSSPAHIFLVCDGNATFEGDTTPHYQLSVYTYDAASKQYGFANVTPNTLTSPDLTLSGTTWTYSGKMTNAGKTIYFRTLNIFESPNFYRFRSESSPDGSHWTTNIEGVSRRL
ncbi:MAG: DUF1579 family protein [Candidatus Eremiobacteraeota bacterium]|nr:DUF1579 family protein [Candidatus Eremiobacteraeota bacterium]